LIVLLLCSTVAGAAAAQPSGGAPPGLSGDELGVRAVVQGFADAWNRHDMEAFSALFAEDADFVNVQGTRWIGRRAIEEAHAASHATVFKESRLAMTETSVRFPGADVAVARTVWKLIGHTSRDGHPAGERTGILTNVLARRGERWEIVVSQNTDIVPPP
jgi:uncharacterized protein (TIGR02246 family)